jgi:hypothetical protein
MLPKSVGQAGTLPDSGNASDSHTNKSRHVTRRSLTLASTMLKVLFRAVLVRTNGFQDLHTFHGVNFRYLTSAWQRFLLSCMYSVCVTVEPNTCWHCVNLPHAYLINSPTVASLPAPRNHMPTGGRGFAYSTSTSGFLAWRLISSCSTSGLA